MDAARLSRTVLAAFLVLALCLGFAVMMPQPAQAAEAQPGETVTLTSGGGTIRYGLALTSDGAGQSGNVSDRCFISKANGYTTGDETTTDGNVCAGAKSTYTLEVNAATGDQDVTFTLTPTWLRAQARAQGLPAPTANPKIVFNSANLGSVSGSADSNGTITIRVVKNTSVTVRFSLSAETQSPVNMSSGSNPEGIFRLGLTGGGAAKDAPTVVADKDLTVLVEPRFDQRISDIVSDSSPTSIGGKRYLGVSAVAVLSGYPSDGSNAAQLNTANFFGKNFFVSDDEISRYTLVMDGMPFRASDVMARDANGTIAPAKIDANGNPYVESRYGKRLKLFVPIDGITAKQLALTTRMDVVDANGNLTRAKDARGVPSNIPAVQGNNDLGANTSDPGNLTACSVSTAMTSQGLRAGDAGYPNNNCAKQTIDLSDFACPSGQCDSTKRDNGNFVKTPIDTNTAGTAVTTSNVALSISPSQARNNPSVCTAWQPGSQYVVAAGNRVGSLPWVGDYTQSITDLYPQAKIYVTTKDVTNTPVGNDGVPLPSEAKPDCSKDGDWTLINDAASGKTGTFLDTKAGIATNAISGFKIVIPGNDVITKTLPITYTATVGSPEVVAKLPSVMSREATPAKYRQTTNYLTVATGQQWSSPVRDYILARTPRVSVRDIWGPTNATAPGIGKQKMVLTSSGQILVENGTKVALNSKDSNGDPNRVFMRIYLSKCLTVDPADLTDPGMSYHRGTISNDPSDCGISKDNYVTRSWVLGDQPNPGSNPSNDPYFPANWAEQNKDSSSVFYNPWGGAKAAPTFTVTTPTWAAPGQVFSTADSWWVTGTTRLNDPAGSVTSQSNYSPAPASEAKPDAYEPGGGLAKNQTITMPSVSAASSLKVVEDPLVPRNTDFAHSVRLYNYTKDRFGQTQFIDVLPYNGDGRGTKYSGDYWLKDFPQFNGADRDKLTILYTTDDPRTVSQCPTNANAADRDQCAQYAPRGALDRAPTTGTNWQQLTPEIVAAQAKPGAQHITALRFDSESFDANASSTYRLLFGADRNIQDDVYANSLGVTSVHKNDAGSGMLPVPAAQAVRTRVFGAKISGSVYADANRDFSKSGSEGGLAGYVVSVYRLDDNGNRITQPDGKPYDQMTTGSNGAYAFDGLQAGKYQVVIERQPAMDAADINTQHGIDTSDTKNTENLWHSPAITVDGSGTQQRPEVKSGNDFGIFKPSLGLAIDKQVDGKDRSVVEAGKTAQFTIDGTNKSNVALTGVRVTDTWVDGKDALNISCRVGDDAQRGAALLSDGGGTLSAGETFRCTADYAMTQDDQDRQSSLVNTAKVSGDYEYTSALDDSGQTREKRSVDAQDSATIDAAAAQPQLQVDKQVDGGPSAVGAAGTSNTFTITGKNSGNLTLHDVKFSDDWAKDEGISDLTCTLDEAAGGGAIDLDGGTFTLDSLAPGAGFSCEGSYAYTQDDVDNQQELLNHVQIEGTTQPAQGDPIHVAAADDVTIFPPSEAPALKLTKSASNWAEGADPFTVGDEIDYEFVVANTGNTTVRGVRIEDPKISGVTCEQTRLAPGQATACTGKYTVTKDDVADDATRLKNTATAHATLTQGGPAIDSNESSAEVGIGAPHLSVDKTVSDGGKHKAGDRVTFTVTLHNDGNTPIDDVELSDPMLDERGIELNCDPSGVNGGFRLGAGASVTCTAELTVTQDDVDAGKDIVNTATADAVYHGTELHGDDQAAFSVSDDAKLSIAKSAQIVDRSGKPAADGDPATPGDTIRYSFDVTNSGDTTITDIAIDDPKLKDADVDVTCDKQKLAPGESARCTADDFTLRSSDVGDDGKEYTNSATADGKGPGDATVTSPKDSVTVPVAYPGIELKKTTDAQGPKSAGDTVNYTFEITNTGSSPLRGILLNDPLLTEHDTEPECEGHDNSFGWELAPGESATCTATITVTQDDVDSGKPVLNTATASGVYHAGEPVTSTANATFDVDTNAGLDVAKRAEVRESNGTAIEGDDPATAGDRVTYVFDVTNTGKTTLEDIRIADSMLEKAKVDVTCEDTKLAPGAHTTCTADEYTVTGDDTADKTTELKNTATARGDRLHPQPGAGPVESEPADAVVKVGRAHVSLSKSVDFSGPFAAGQDVTYTVTAKNDGTTPLRDVDVRDPMLADRGVELACDPAAEDGQTLSLNPGDEVSCTGTLRITQDDVDAGKDIVNTAGVTAGYHDAKVKDEAKATISVTSDAALSLNKTAEVVDADGQVTDPGEVLTEGDTVRYRFAVKNTGAVTIDKVSIDDPMLQKAGVDLSCPADGEPQSDIRLAPGETIDCLSQAYTITAQDAKDGTVKNTATAGGTAPNGDTVDSPEATASVDAELPRVSLTKSIRDEKKSYRVGDRISYELRVENTGKTVLRHAKVTDQLLEDRNAQLSCEPEQGDDGFELKPGGTATCRGEITVEAGDASAGTLTNSARVSGDYRGAKAADEDSVKAAIRGEDDSTPTASPTTSPTEGPQPTPRPSTSGPDNPGANPPGEGPGDDNGPGNDNGPGDSGPLPFTGARIVAIIIAAAALLTLGGALMFAGRRRPRH